MSGFHSSRLRYLLAAAVLFFFVSAAGVLPADAGQVAVKQFGGEEPAPEKDEDWSKDLDKKIDTTIKVLQVIKEEVKDIEPPAKSLKQGAGKAAAQEEDWTENLKRWIQRAARIWRKIRKVTAPAGAPAGPAADDQAELTKDLSEKLAKTISAMQVIKEELDKISEEEK